MTGLPGDRLSCFACTGVPQPGGSKAPAIVALAPVITDLLPDTHSTTRAPRHMGPGAVTHSSEARPRSIALLEQTPEDGAQVRRGWQPGTSRCMISVPSAMAEAGRRCVSGSGLPLGETHMRLFDRRMHLEDLIQ
jgi:hypothetical protein